MNGLAAYWWLIVGLLMCAALIVVWLLSWKAGRSKQEDLLGYAFFGPFWLKRNLTRGEKIGWVIFLLILGGGITFSHYLGAERPTIFNVTTGERTELDDLAHEYFGKLYEVVDVNVRERAFVNAKGTSGFGTTAPVYVEGRCVRRNMTVLYVITAEGSVDSTYAAKATDPRLSEAALRAMTQRRFRPTQVDGRVIPIIAATQFAFNCPA